MPTIIDGSASATFATPLPVSEGGTGSTVGAAYGRVVRTAGDITTTSTTLVDVAGATITFTTGAFPVAYGATQTMSNDSLGTFNVYNIDIDGTLQFGTDGASFRQPVAGYNVNASFSGQSAVLSAASHTIKERWLVSAGTGTIQGGTDQNHLFYAQEIR